MVRRSMKKLIVILTIIVIFCQAKADIIINEVMSNEPGSQVSLEWVELYNDSDSAKYLAFYTLEIGSGVFNFPGETIGGHDFLVVCRRLATSGSTAGFESFWGNNSGIWGDAPSESFKLYQFAGMSLANDSGTVVLKYGGIVKSTFKWTSAGVDGVSWERFAPTSLAISNCIDPRGGTPGRINSITPGNADLALMSLEAMPLDSGNTLILLQVANAGLTYLANNKINLYYDLDRDSSVTNADLIEILDLPAMSSNDTFDVEFAVQLEGIYPSILAKLPADDRLTNNVRIATVPGKLFPPVIISEFMADPQVPLGYGMGGNNKYQRQHD